MDAKLKQRFIGAIVLTALAIIILPMVLDGSSEDRARVIASIPEPPVVEFQRLEVDEVHRRMDEMTAESAARLPQPARDSGEETPAVEQPSSEEAFALDENEMPVTWTLQVGSFKEQERAIRLRASLRESEYRSYIIHADDTPEGDTYRVFVGPMLEKEKLREISKQIESRFDLKGLIVRYRVEDDSGQLGG